MVKKISCKVVRSVPLSKSSSVLPHSSESNNEHRKADDIAGADVHEPADNGNSATHASRLDAAGIYTSAEDGLTGKMLDCYV